MALISIENMRFRAFHGLYEEERILGNDFLVDVWIDSNIHSADVVYEHETEKMTGSVNYATVYDIVSIIMREPEYLIETVVGKIIKRLKFQFGIMTQCRVQVRKLQPPVGGIVSFSSVTDGETFGESCGKCGGDMLCYADETCWCVQNKENIHPRTLEKVAQQFNGCLCQRCLGQLTG
jgi:7,8-dihydroneopterin aldolase/epimerase/oxygenase